LPQGTWKTTKDKGKLNPWLNPGTTEMYERYTAIQLLICFKCEILNLIQSTKIRGRVVV
jgi:hypothetical protein